MTRRPKDFLKSKKVWIPVAFVVVLIVIRAFLPFIVTSYVNKTLSNIPGYQGHIDDVDISLIRGAYVIENIRLEKISANIPVPFFSAKKLDLSLEWSSILNASLVGEVEIVEPKLNFVQGRTEKESQDGSEANFAQKLKELFPLKINRFDITNGEVHFRNFHSKPKVDIFIDSLFIHATNLTNSKKVSKTLVASIDARGKAMGTGRLVSHLDIDPYTPFPTFNLDFRLERVDLRKMNNFFDAYASVDVESGTFQVYAELAASNGKFTGYVKPLFEHLRILDVKTDNENPLKLLWEALVEGVTRILTNPSKDQLGTTIPLSGRFDDPDADILSTLGGLLKNAFIQALRPGIEGTITLQKAKAE